MCKFFVPVCLFGTVRLLGTLKYSVKSNLGRLLHKRGFVDSDMHTTVSTVIQKQMNSIFVYESVKIEWVNGVMSYCAAWQHYGR